MICDDQGSPIDHALMYNDASSVEEAKLIEKISSGHPIVSSPTNALVRALSLIKKISTDFPNSTILLTTSTQSSNKVIRNRKIKNVILQFAPIDIQFVMKKFLNYWKPDICILIESEIWPNILFSFFRNA